ncbi:hypothetical protein Oweho_3366 [Owenweeksia hongkongensis DSM 17368]|uniref:Uncharacterized protein n=1 Tax=Owenweeksia hongkongensis (strain DSM 17368 / CIP 108786 / JCM 12287 / NRRL B-23963 / UST20020801) TaxID=926562 RepID=G8R503_OWEHD|nr:hypothetical protein Oweho_3366 [Owenweeksia hongkongensis DSM 17368]
MRLNSTSWSKVLKFVYLMCIMAFVFDVLMVNIDGSWGSFIKLSPFALLVILFLIYRGKPQFIYDSDGEVLNFTASEPNLKFLGKYFVTHTEFPKRKLASYKIRSYPFRRKLTVYINSKDGSPKKQKISISYLRRREVRDLKRSLDRVLVTNRQNQ